MVGSLPRPRWLKDAFNRFKAGEMKPEQYDKLVDDAVRLTVKEEELTGIDVVTDGEQRRVSFVSFVGQTIPGFSLVHINQISPDAIRLMQEEKAPLTYWRAVAVGSIRDAPMAVGELKFTKSVTAKPVKVTLPSPYLVMWETWDSNLSRPFYRRPEDLAGDYVKIVRKEIVRLRDAGAAFIQLDEPMLGDLVEAGEEPDRYRRFIGFLHGQKYRGFRDELLLGRDLVNEAVKGVSGVRIGMHMDRWPAKGLPNRGVGFERLLPEVLDIKVKQYVLEYACEGSGDPAKFVEQMPGDKEIGLGVIDVTSPAVESPETIVRRVRRAGTHVDPERIWLNPDCGFAPGMFRKFERRIAFQKLRSMAEAARNLRGE